MNPKQSITRVLTFQRNDGSCYSCSMNSGDRRRSQVDQSDPQLDVWAKQVGNIGAETGNTLIDDHSITVELPPRRVKVRDQVYTLVAVDPSGHVMTIAITDREAVKYGFRDTADYMDQCYLGNYTAVQCFNNEVEYEVEE